MTCLRRCGASLFLFITFAVTLTLAAQTSAAPGSQVSAQGAQAYEIVVEQNVMITMRDGVKLACDIYRPARNGVAVEGKFPVILERTPYDKATARHWAEYFVPRGYIGVGQDVRGRFASQGSWRMLRDDVNDGYDTAKWIGEQPWSNGAIGTVGTSYPGGTQHALAISNPPYLKAMVPNVALSDAGYYGIRHHGAFELRFFNWIFNIGAPLGSASSQDPKAKEALAKTGQQVREYVRRLPLRPGTTPLKLAPEYEAWLVEAMRHGDNDAFWRDIGSDVVDHLAEYKDIPVYHVTGWYDSWTAQVANMNYVALAKAKKSPQRLLVGPWLHGGERRSFASEAEFGADAAIDFNALRLRWFDHWLKGVDNGVERDAPVRIFIMGGGDAHRTPEGRVFVGGHWREEREWPLARALSTPYYLRQRGVLSPEKPAMEAPTSFQFDPHHPVPTIGGNISSHNAPLSGTPTLMRPGDTGNLMESGAYDQRCRANLWTCDDELPLSARNDVLVFQSAPLERDMEVTGTVVVKLWVESDAPDTDFTAKLVDVYPPNSDFPAGVDLNIGDSIVRARYRNSLEKAELMKPGEIYPVTIELYPTSLVFKKGHRIRLDISSSNFPRFDVNPNTGEPLNDNRRWAVAVNTIYHDAQRPSQIVLPVIPTEVGR